MSSNPDQAALEADLDIAIFEFNAARGLVADLAEQLDGCDGDAGTLVQIANAANRAVSAAVRVAGLRAALNWEDDAS